MKKRTLNLIDLRTFKDSPRFVNTKQDFKVESSVNLIDYFAGTFLTEDKVKEILTSDVEVKIRLFKNSDSF